MKNREKYKNELIKVIKKDGKLCEFVKKHEVFRMFGKDSTNYCKMTCVTCGTALQIWLDEEYKEPEVDWVKVPVDTLVRVRDREEQKWTLMYFKGISDYDRAHRFMTWCDGATSKTAFGGDYVRWKYCELVEDEDNDK
jgi:hypothetical protein